MTEKNMESWRLQYQPSNASKSADGRQGKDPLRSQTAVIPVMDLANARLKESISLLNAAAQNTGRSTVFQQLPKHMRRRAMSHKPKRLPRRHQQTAKEQMQTPQDPKKVNRKHRRRPRNLKKEFSQRPGHATWMETHIWHAKRMHMGDRWGLKLALYPNDKHERALYRALKNQATIHDASYWTPIELEYTGLATNALLICQEMLKSVNAIGAPNSGIAAQHLVGRDFRYQGNLHVYDQSTYVGEIQVQFVGNSLLWVWAHPASAGSVKELLSQTIHQDVRVNDPIKFPPQRFELRGPRAAELITRCFMGYENADVTKLSTSGLQAMPRHGIQATVVVNPMRTFPPARLLTGRRDKVEEQGHSHLNVPQDSEDAVDAFGPKSRETLFFAIDDSEDLEKANEDPNGKVKERRMRHNSKIKNKFLLSGDRGIKVPLMIIRRGCHSKARALYHGVNNPGKQPLEGYDLVIPAGWGRAFWNPLVFASARVMGLNNLYQLSGSFAGPLTGAGIMGLPFPWSSPDTPAYREMMDQDRFQAETKYVSKPPAKRINYHRLAQPSPFAPDWGSVCPGKKPFHVLRKRELLKTLYIVVNRSTDVNMQKRNKVANQLAGKSALADLEAVVSKDDTQQALVMVSITALEGNPERWAPLSLASLSKPVTDWPKQEPIKVAAECVPAFPTVGYAETIGFNDRAGKCAGMGFVSLRSLLEFAKLSCDPEKSLQIQHQFLIRPLGSPQYRPVVLQIHIPST
eukprot:Clim_evm10s155 gene=Clim_evmTU10s155